jgi:polysaccharide biosynthesis transport protein
VTKMRNDVKVEPISTNVKDPRTGRAASATIAFTLSYEGKVPETVHQVANTLTTLFLTENQQIREHQTMVTSQFLELEMNRVKNEIVALDDKITAFKETHMHELPELFQTNFDGKERIERDIDRLNDQIRTLKERESFLLSQISGLSVNYGNEDKKRLEELKIQIVQLKTQFSEKHPDVINTRKEIADLEKKIADDRPGLQNRSVTALISIDSDNPAHMTLMAQLKSTGFEIESLTRQIQSLQERAEEYRRRIEQSPQIENTYANLLNERKNTQAKYNDLMGKYMESQVAHGLEKERKGERFSILDPARLPGNPVRPNRKVIVLLGFVVAAGAGVGFATMRELSDDSIRDSRRLTRATPYPVLISIPKVEKKKPSTDIIKQASEPATHGWKAPAYMESRAVELNPECLCENSCVCFFSEAPEMNYYKLLRTKIMHHLKLNKWNTIMITSTLPGEGKTVTAINLAATFAKIHSRTTLLVDCDLQRQSIHKYLGIPSPLGLADYLSKDMPIKDVIIWPGVEKLTVISGGDEVRDSTELISSPKMEVLTIEMKNRYPNRYIIYDVPPLLAAADALSFTPLVDCILMVVHPKTTFENLQKALAMVPKEKLLGFVLNQVDESNDDNYWYKYGYGK